MNVQEEPEYYVAVGPHMFSGRLGKQEGWMMQGVRVVKKEDAGELRTMRTSGGQQSLDTPETEFRDYSCEARAPVCGHETRGDQ